MKIAIVGDYRPHNETHRAVTEGLTIAGAEIEWVPSREVEGTAERLAGYGGVLAAPGSPYASMEGVLAAIRHARERGVPFAGTWGGFQHAIIEIARNVLGIEDADHAETNPEVKRLVIVPLACSLVGQEQPVEIESGTRAATLYRTTTPTEPYYCNYGLNPGYETHLADAGVVVSGRGPAREVRIIELPSHPFFIGTLFVPRPRRADGKPHPIYAGLSEAVRKRRRRSGAVQ